MLLEYRYALLPLMNNLAFTWIEGRHHQAPNFKVIKVLGRGAWPPLTSPLHV